MLEQLAALYDIRIALVILIAALLWYCLFSRPDGYPPGRHVISDLLRELTKGTGAVDFKTKIRHIRQKYGNINSMAITRNKMVVSLHSFDVMKEALVKCADVFSDRPEVFLTKYLGKGRGLISRNGKIWKEQRKFTLEMLREFGMGKVSLEKKILEEVTAFIDRIEEENGQPFDPRHFLQTSICNVICSIMFGSRYEYNNPKFKRFFTSMDNLFSRLHSLLLNVFPIVRFIPGDPFYFHVLVKEYHEIQDFLMSEIDNHKESFQENDIRDFIDAYLLEMSKRRENDPDTSFNEEELVAIINDLFGAGTETTATTLCWIIIYILRYPDVQARVRAEIDEVVGKNRLPSIRNRPEMPYTEATVMEIMRHANIAPFAVPHAVSENITFRGFRIPKGTMITFDMDSIFSDSTIFPEPDNFEPSRFIDSNGKIKHIEEFIPFSIGRRMCIGEALAKMETFLFFSCLVQRFDFSLPDDKDPSKLDGVFGVTHKPNPYKVRAVKRI